MLSKLWGGPRSALDRVGETVSLSGHFAFVFSLWLWVPNQMATFVVSPCFFTIRKYSKYFRIFNMLFFGINLNFSRGSCKNANDEIWTFWLKLKENLSLIVMSWDRVELWWARILKVISQLLKKAHFITDSPRIISSDNLMEIWL